MTRGFLTSFTQVFDLQTRGDISIQRRKSFALGCALAATILFSARPAYAGEIKIDTLKGLAPGITVGCDYTFKNGDPSIPCAKDVVGADGTVSFVKPSAPFDNIEYYQVIGPLHVPIVALFNPLNDPIIDTLTSGMEFPILTRSGGSSFFDIFVEIDLSSFIADGNAMTGIFTTGQTLTFSGGINTDGYDGLTIPGYSGTALVTAFDHVSSVPEPATLTLLPPGLLGLRLYRLRTKKRGA